MDKLEDARMTVVSMLEKIAKDIDLDRESKAHHDKYIEYINNIDINGDLKDRFVAASEAAVTHLYLCVFFRIDDGVDQSTFRKRIDRVYKEIRKVKYA